MARAPRNRTPRPRDGGTARGRGRTPVRIGWLALACIAGLALVACAPPRGLVVQETPQAFAWADDDGTPQLSQALERSIAYYRRLGPGTVFRYGELVYTPEEMAASLELFHSTFLAAETPAQLGRLIAQRFHVFESVREEGDNLFTGYYEPELEASETPTDALRTPLFALPEDMVRVRLDRFGGSLPAVTLVGRVVQGELLPYLSRRDIQTGEAFRSRAELIAYVDEIELFFLQIQGSGVLRFADGRRVKVGYAGSNGHPYRSIGAVLVRDEALRLEDVSLQSIRAWLLAHPEEKQRVLYANPSYVFFQVREEGPLGNLQVELTPGRSLAVDQRLIPAGGLVYVQTLVPVPRSTTEAVPVGRFMLAQDTGGAIRGHGRGDLFWGAGADAEWIAGHQKHFGRLLLLVARKDQLPAATAASP